MPRFPKGSEEAKAWGLKMKKARDLKKSMKGGMMGGSDEEDIDAVDAIVRKFKQKSPVQKAEQLNKLIKIAKKEPSVHIPTKAKSSLIKYKKMKKEGEDNALDFLIDKFDTEGSGMPSLKMEVPGSKARRGRKPLNVMNGGFLQPGQIPPQEMEGGSLKSRLAAIRAKLQQLKDRYN